MFSNAKNKISSDHKDRPKMFYFVKHRDTRCSTRCVQNWTRYKQSPPIGHYCSCIKR